MYADSAEARRQARLQIRHAGSLWYLLEEDSREEPLRPQKWYQEQMALMAPTQAFQSFNLDLRNVWQVEGKEFLEKVREAHSALVYQMTVFAERWSAIEEDVARRPHRSMDWYIGQINSMASRLDIDTMSRLSDNDFYEKIKEAQLVISKLSLEDQATPAAWDVPYSGSTHNLLRQAIEDASATGDGPYCRFFSIIQSSGMGKSRTVNELAKQMFTIPFNIGERLRVKSYPPPDDDIRSHFARFPLTTRLETSGYYLAFFKSLFDIVRGILEDNMDWGSNLPQRWYEFLKSPSPGDPEKTNRDLIYNEICAKSVDLQEEIQREVSQLSEKERSDVAPFRTAIAPRAKKALDQMTITVAKFGIQQPRSGPSVLMYFDECHVLSKLHCRRDGDEGGNHFDALCSALNVLGSYGLFTVFLSNNSTVQLHPPVLKRLSSARATHPPSHAPFTELPFDCHPQFPIYDGLHPRQYWRPLTREKICQLEFLCSFGRPMFRARYEALHDMIKDNVIQFAMTKLSGSAEHWAFSPYQVQRDSESEGSTRLTDWGAARLAVLDIRLSLDFESHRQPIHTSMETKLVEDYMRVVFSIPHHREYWISGYPSEPILAEAATRLMRTLCAEELDIVSKILRQHVDNGLLSKDDGAKMVARLLLTLAYDEACQKVKNGVQPYSRPIPVKDFLQALIGVQHWERIKTSYAENLPSGVTMEEAFHNA